jgi:multicomponent Na+:H+ antiporter subunit E
MMAFWLILSGMYDLFHIALGVISVTVVLWFNTKLRNHNFFDENECRAANFKVLRLLYFVPFLVWEIISSSFRIAYIIIHPKMPMKTAIIKFKTNLPNMNAKVLLGNSITLTPGTVTLQIEGDEFLIHSLTNEAVEAHIDHSLTVEVAKVYGTDPERVVYHEEIITSQDQL